MLVPAHQILAVIPALNEEHHIEACIRSLMTGDTALRDIRLVVADGGSSDKTREIVRALVPEFPELRLIDNTRRLQAAAVNLAVQTQAEASHTIMVRCDAHSIYPPDFILDAARRMREVNAASLVVPMDAVGTGCFGRATAWVVDTVLGSGGAAHRGGRVSGFVDHGHHAAFDLSWFRRAGGYDETFTHNEDAEYDVRLAKAGGRIYLDAAIRIQYIPRDTLKGLARQSYNYGKGRARTLRKHGGRPKLRQFLPAAALLGTAGGLLMAPLYPVALILPLGYLSILAAASLAVALWKTSLCGLLAGAACGTIHMSWAVGFLRQWLTGRA